MTQKNKTFPSIVLLLWISGSRPQQTVKEFEPKAIAVAVAHQIQELKLGQHKDMCLALPKLKDPDKAFLREINRNRLHLLRGSSCWKTGTGDLLIVRDYRKIDTETIELHLEVHRTSNDSDLALLLNKAAYKLRRDNTQWKIESYQAE